MHYLRNFVLAAFRAAHPDDLEPSKKMIDKFDKTLFGLYDDEVARQAVDNGVDLDDFNRSILVFFADQSTSDAVETRVEDAFIYFLKVHPLP